MRRAPSSFGTWHGRTLSATEWPSLLHEGVSMSPLRVTSLSAIATKGRHAWQSRELTHLRDRRTEAGPLRRRPCPPPRRRRRRRTTPAVLGQIWLWAAQVAMNDPRVRQSRRRFNSRSRGAPDSASSVWIGLVDRRGPALVPTQPQQQQTTVRTPSRRQRVTPGREVGPCFEIPVHALHCAEVSARGLSDATSVTMSRP